MTADDKEQKKSLFRLIADLPGLLSSLIRGEINLLKAELVGKAKSAGIGVALIAVAIAVVVLGFITLIFSGIAALALVLPLWASALIVTVLLFIVAGILVAMAVASFKKFNSPIPQRTRENLQKDFETVTGKDVWDEYPRD